MSIIPAALPEGDVAEPQGSSLPPLPAFLQEAAFRFFAAPPPVSESADAALAGAPPADAPAPPGVAAEAHPPEGRQEPLPPVAPDPPPAGAATDVAAEVVRPVPANPFYEAVALLLAALPPGPPALPALAGASPPPPSGPPPAPRFVETLADSRGDWFAAGLPFAGEVPEPGPVIILSGDWV